MDTPVELKSPVSVPLTLPVTSPVMLPATLPVTLPCKLPSNIGDEAIPVTFIYSNLPVGAIDAIPADGCVMVSPAPTLIVPTS